jgi:phosphate transport system protein
MPEELRTAFHQQLGQIEASMTRLFAMVAEGLAAATDAILSGDRDVVRMLVERESTIDSLYLEVEQLVNSTITLQAPVAADLRFLLSVLRIVPELERSHDLVEHIARRGAQGISTDLSPRTRGLIEQMGSLGSDMWQRAGTAFLARDPHEAGALAQLDDQMDELHSLATAELASGKMPLPVAMDMTLVARFYERLGDHAVNIARRVVYLAGAPGGSAG